MKIIQNNCDDVVQICLNCNSVLLVNRIKDTFESYDGSGKYQWECPCCKKVNNFKEDSLDTSNSDSDL